MNNDSTVAVNESIFTKFKLCTKTRLGWLKSKIQEFKSLTEARRLDLRHRRVVNDLSANKERTQNQHQTQTEIWHIGHSVVTHWAVHIVTVRKKSQKLSLSFIIIKSG